MGFFLWYYSKGLKKFFLIWRNYLEFFWNFFSVGRFLRTLFSPWKRDVSRVHERGFHPILLLKALLENIFTRCIGAIIKTVMICVGLIFEIITIPVGFGLLLFWLAAPLLIIIFLGGLFFIKSDVTNIIWLVTFLLSCLFIIISLFTYRSEKKDYFSMPLPILAKEKWFKRVWNRIGLEGKEIDLEILSKKEKIKNFLRSIDLIPNEFAEVVEWEINRKLEAKNKRKFWLRENLMSILPIGRHWAYAFTIHLDEYSTDLSEGDFSEYRNARLFGKENDLNELKQLLLRPLQNNVIVVGEPGVGRDTIIHTLAREIRSNQLSGPLSHKRILELDIKAILADHAAIGDSDQILEKLFSEAAYAGNIILILKDIHECVDYEGRDISHILSEFLALPTFQIIGTTTPFDFHSKIEKKSNIMKYCEKILVDEMSQEDTLKVMQHKLKSMEGKNIIFTYQGLREIIKLADRYVADSPFPEKALDLMEEVLLYWENSASSRFITEKVVNEAISAKIKVPLGEIESTESEKLLNLEEHLHKRVVGQDFAIKQIAETMRRARVGMSQKNKPIGSFLFLGPTGVGKTESSKALAEAYFGGEDRMIRLDMSEYQMQESIDRLIGSQSNNKEGYLVSKVKENPCSLLLLDEIEKAHPDILNLFLQILDEGYLTDALGKKVNFRNLIIIATSNVGAQIIKESIQKNIDPKEIQKQVVDYAINQGIFRPEFLNRFEGVVFFNSLSREEIYKITSLLLEKYAQNLREQENIEVNFGTGVVEKIVGEAFDPVFGARAINRYIQDKIGDSIVKRIISGEIKKGVDFVFEVSEIE